uniref:Uncharacterized protein n=1 Tax=Chromera velia CCMP2878 TaxID=1169474 RepID=A0A0G4F6S6_9ALVE|eukprot:Cvel_15367.t1-p1 / transcript=Cvel_15367.t1 / gene=Cvel_15367 / organism=Chromera_velia_CCMP2878 / gene_product=hypothetical protein / transcript_product=hypothetical protein / location=Cvel_scaffold1133:43-1950(-) / protein_length=433 / sequence_SO=supercontig / SO=protein_coding / is_pseudo=false
MSLENTLKIVGSATGMSPKEYVVYVNNVFNAAISEGRTDFWTDERFADLIGKMQAKLISFEAADLYRLIVSFARVQFWPSMLRDRVLDLVVDSVGELEFEHLCHLPLALSALGSAAEGLSSSIQAICEEIEKRLQAPPSDGVPLPRRELVFALLGLSNLLYRREATVSLICTALRPQLSKCSSAQLATIALSLSTLGCSEIPTIAPEETTKNGHPASSDSSDIFPPASLSLSTEGLGAFAFASRLDAAIAERLEPSAADPMRPGQIANVLVALASSQRLPMAFLSDILREIRRSHGGSAWPPEDALTAAWALCCMSLFDKDVLRPLLERAAVCLGGETGEEGGGVGSVAAVWRQARQIAVCVGLEGGEQLKAVGREGPLVSCLVLLAAWVFSIDRQTKFDALVGSSVFLCLFCSTACVHASLVGVSFSVHVYI